MLESAIVLGIGCSIGALFGLYGQFMLTRWLSDSTGFPTALRARGLLALATFAGVTLVAVAIAALPGFAAARVSPAARAARGLIDAINVSSSVAEIRPARLPTLASMRSVADASHGSACARARRAGARDGALLARRLPARARAAARVAAAGRPRSPIPSLRAQALATLRERALQRRRRRAVRRDDPEPRDPELVRALVAYQVICDYLDTLAEQPSERPDRQRRAAAPRARRRVADGPLADHYRVRMRCATTAATSRRSSPPAARAARGCPHMRPCARRRRARRAATRCRGSTTRRRACASRRCERGPTRPEQATPPATGDATWFELAAAGSSSLAVLALIAAAPTPRPPRDAAEQCGTPTSRGSRRSARCSTASPTASATCGPASSTSSASTATRAIGVARLREVTARAIAGARGLPRGERHVVLVAGMIAMHVSEPGAWLPWARPADARRAARRRRARDAAAAHAAARLAARRPDRDRATRRAAACAPACDSINRCRQR